MVDQAKARVTQDDLQRLEAAHDDKTFEVEDGEIVEREKGMTPLHVVVTLNLYDILKPFVKAHMLGRVFTDGVRYILEAVEEDIQRAYQPDFSFLRASRITTGFNWRKDVIGAPDLAVEVASPGQGGAFLFARMERFILAGSEEAWLIYPLTQKVYQFRRDEDEPRIYLENDTIDTSTLFPGLVLPMRALFVTDDQ